MAGERDREKNRSDGSWFSDLGAGIHLEDGQDYEAVQGK